MYAESKHLPRVLAKQYGEVLVDGEEAVKRISIQQLPGSSLGQQVAEGPVGVGGSNQPLRSLHLRLRLQMEQLPTHIAVASCRGRAEGRASILSIYTHIIRFEHWVFAITLWDGRASSSHHAGKGEWKGGGRGGRVGTLWDGRASSSHEVPGWRELICLPHHCCQTLFELRLKVNVILQH